MASTLKVNTITEHTPGAGVALSVPVRGPYGYFGGGSVPISFDVAGGGDNPASPRAAFKVYSSRVGYAQLQNGDNMGGLQWVGAGPAGQVAVSATIQLEVTNASVNQVGTEMQFDLGKQNGIGAVRVLQLRDTSARFNVNLGLGIEALSTIALRLFATTQTFGLVVGAAFAETIGNPMGAQVIGGTVASSGHNYATWNALQLGPLILGTGSKVNNQQGLQVSGFDGSFGSSATEAGGRAVAVLIDPVSIGASDNFGILIGDVTGSSAFAIKTGLGVVSFGDLLTTIASAAGHAGFRLPHGAAPSSPGDGDVWTTTSGLFVRINGVTKTVTLT